MIIVLVQNENLWKCSSNVKTLELTKRGFHVVSWKRELPKSFPGLNCEDF